MDKAIQSEMSREDLIVDLLEVRRSLFMWTMSLKEVDRMLVNFGYDVSDLPQYIESQNTTGYDIEAECDLDD